MGRGPPEALGVAPTLRYAAADCTSPAEVTQVSACTCGQRRAPALCPRGPFGSGPGHRPYLPPEPNPDSLPPPLLVRGLLSPSPSPSPSTCPASRPGRRRGCAASRPARPRRPAQADSQGQPSPSPVLHPPPPRGRVSAARSASPAAAAVRRTGGRAVRGLRRHRSEGGLGRRARCGGGSVARAPPTAPGEPCCFPPASWKCSPVRSGTFKWVISTLCLGAGDPAGSEADSSFTAGPAPLPPPPASIWCRCREPAGHSGAAAAGCGRGRRLVGESFPSSGFC